MTDDPANTPHHPPETNPASKPTKPVRPTIDPVHVPGEDPQKAREATEAGVSAFGENYAQNDTPESRPTDDVLEDVRAAFYANPRTRPVADQVVIQITGDSVLLRGQVDTPATIDTLIVLAQSVEGVSEVHSELQH